MWGFFHKTKDSYLETMSSLENCYCNKNLNSRSLPFPFVVVRLWLFKIADVLNQVLSNTINVLSVTTECFIDLGKLNLLKISLPWSKSVKLTVAPP